MKGLLLPLPVLLARVHAAWDLNSPIPAHGSGDPKTASIFSNKLPSDILGTTETEVAKPQNAAINPTDLPTLTSTSDTVTAAPRSVLVPTARRVKRDGTTTTPPTTVFTGSVQTQYGSISGLSDVSQTTTVVNSSTVVLPVWNCAKETSAEACKACPTGTAAPSCTSGFNAIVLIPPLAALGVALIPPPPGLPTLIIDEGTVETYTEPSKPSSTDESSSSSSSSSDTESTIPLSCVKPSYGVKDLGADSIQTSWAPGASHSGAPPAGTGTPAPIDKDNDLPVLPLTGLQVLNPTNTHQLLDSPIQTAALGCGGYGMYDQYYNMGFYQYDATFSRQDALRAIRSFCSDMAKKDAILGPSGFYLKDGDHKNLATDLYIKAYPGGTDGFKGQGKEGLITVRALFDVEDRYLNGERGKCARDGTTLFPFKGHEGECFTLLGQSIDYCQIDDKRKSTDQKWKIGGTFYKDCMFWDVFPSPNDRDFSGSFVPRSLYHGIGDSTTSTSATPTGAWGANPTNTIDCRPTDAPLISYPEQQDAAMKFCEELSKKDTKLDPKHPEEFWMSKIDPDGMIKTEDGKKIEVGIAMNLNGTFDGQKHGCNADNAPTYTISGDAGKYDCMRKFNLQGTCDIPDKGRLGGTRWVDCIMYSWYTI